MILERETGSKLSHDEKIYYISQTCSENPNNCGSFYSLHILMMLACLLACLLDAFSNSLGLFHTTRDTSFEMVETD